MRASIAALAAALLLTGCVKADPQPDAEQTQTAAVSSEAQTETTVSETTVSETTTTRTEMTLQTETTAVSTETTTQTETSDTTVPAGSSASGTTGTTITSALTEKELSDMEAVDDVLSTLMQNPEYKKMQLSQQTDTVRRRLIQLATEGTKQKPYPLIEPLSILYDESMQQFSFTYACGVKGGVRLRPFDPQMN